jgi:hypothetical protein
MNVYKLVSLAGLLVLMTVAWVFSENRRRVNWRVIGWGTGLQLLLCRPRVGHHRAAAAGPYDAFRALHDPHCILGAAAGWTLGVGLTLTKGI